MCHEKRTGYYILFVSQSTELDGIFRYEIGVSSGLEKTRQAILF